MNCLIRCRDVYDLGIRIALALLIGVSALAWAGGAGASPLTVGAYYYAWYGSDGAHWDLGTLRGGLDPAEPPQLGYYDSRDPAVITQHYAWAHQYGIDVFFTSWRGPDSVDDTTIRDDLLPSPARGPTQIALLYESIERLGMGPDNRITLTPDSEQRMLDDFDYMARTYFDRPGYYRIDGRPVVIVYASRILRGDVGETIHAIREHLITTYGVNPYLIGDEVDWDQPPDPFRIGLYDAITGYTPYSRTQPAGWPSETGWLQAVDRRTRQFRKMAAGRGRRIHPRRAAGLRQPRRAAGGGGARPAAGARAAQLADLGVRGLACAGGRTRRPVARAAQRDLLERVERGQPDRADRRRAGADLEPAGADAGVLVPAVRLLVPRRPEAIRGRVALESAV